MKWCKRAGWSAAAVLVCFLLVLRVPSSAWVHLGWLLAGALVWAGWLELSKSMR